MVMVNENEIEQLTERFVNLESACEAGLFDRSFTCTETETERCMVGTVNVRLCASHRDVINITPTANDAELNDDDD